MPDTYDLNDIALSEDAEILSLVNACPDIEPVCFHDEEFLIRATTEESDQLQLGFHIFLVLKGSCLVEHPHASEERKPGSELAVLHATPQEPLFLGEMAYLGSGFRTASVRSSMNTFTLKLKPAHLDIIIDQYHGLTRILCRQFASRLADTNKQLESFQKLLSLSGEHVFLSPGDVLIKSGEPVEKLYQLVDGELHVGEGDSAVSLTPVQGDPQFVQPEAFFLDAEYKQTITAATPAILVAYEARDKEKIVRNYPGLVLSLLGSIPDVK